MKNFLNVTVMIFLFIWGKAAAQASRHPIVIGDRVTFNSEILQEKRELWMHVPDGISGEVPAGKKYPVLYLLDGGAHFSAVVGLIQQLSAVNGNTACPKMIVVGIPNTNRTRDLTPTRGKPGQPYVDSVMIANSGGGEQFIAFVEKELIPFIDSTYSTAPYRLLVGHSFGGLTVMNTLVHHRHLFDAYVAIDPAMSWDDQHLLNQMTAGQVPEKYQGESLFLAMANTMEPGMDTSRVQQDTAFATSHIRSILELDQHLNRQANGHLRYQSNYYERDDHTSVFFIAVYDALRFLYEGHQFRISYADYLDPDNDIFERVLAHYKRLSGEFGYEVKPPEAFVNNLGYSFLNLGRRELARQFFQLNMSYYPSSYNAFDSLGDYYRAAGDREKAIRHYWQSLRLNPDSHSKKKLELLLKE